MSTPGQLVVGTAGHIDHGKSSLVRALTGVDPDRLPEEKARGMTIDLGFAHRRVGDADIWFVDVPGHERFIRNMVAGATGVDAALLVVAADDSIMPQTREHAELLALLGITRCVLVLTKIDLVDAEWAAVVEGEARELLGALGMTPVECVHTSVQTGAGLDALCAVLEQLAAGRDAASGERAGEPAAWFRMPIDRAFAVAGRGAVVTGSVAHGSVRRDDELELWPGARRVRVRDLQSHNEGRVAANGRMRLALNLTGAALADLYRGCELATPGYLAEGRCHAVRVTRFRMPGSTRRQRVRVRLHTATTETRAELRLLRKPEGETVRGELAQLITLSPIVATVGQRFILRDDGGARTLGGGVLLLTPDRPWSAARPPDPESLTVLHTGDATPPEVAASAVERRVEVLFRLRGWDTPEPARIAAQAAVPDAAAAERCIANLIAQRRLVLLDSPGGGKAIHVDTVKAAAGAVTSRLVEHLRENPRLPGVNRSEWPGWMPRACPARLRPALAEWLLESGEVALQSGHVVPRGHAGAISAADERLLDALLEEIRAAAYQPPEFDALSMRTAKNDKRLRQLIDLAVARGQLVRIEDRVWLHGDFWNDLTRSVAAAVRARGPLSVSDVRELTKSTRKYVVPLLERLDAAGITRRLGDKRVLGPKAPPEPSVAGG